MIGIFDHPVILATGGLGTLLSCKQILNESAHPRSELPAVRNQGHKLVHIHQLLHLIGSYGCAQLREIEFSLAFGVSLGNEFRSTGNVRLTGGWQNRS